MPARSFLSANPMAAVTATQKTHRSPTIGSFSSPHRFPRPRNGCSKPPAPAVARGRTASRPAPPPRYRREGPVRARSRTALLAARRVPGQVPQPRAARSPPRAARAVPHRDHRVRPRYGGNKFLRAVPPLRNAQRSGTAGPPLSERGGAGSRGTAAARPPSAARCLPLLSLFPPLTAEPRSQVRELARHRPAAPPAPPRPAPRRASPGPDPARPGRGFAGQRPEPRGAERSGAQRRARTRCGRAGPAAALREETTGMAAPLPPPTAAGRDSRRGTAGPGGGAERRGAAFKGPLYRHFEGERGEREALGGFGPPAGEGRGAAEARGAQSSLGAVRAGRGEAGRARGAQLGAGRAAGRGS